MIIEGEEDKMARWDAHQRLKLQGSGLIDHVRCLLPFAWKLIASALRVVVAVSHIPCLLSYFLATCKDCLQFSSSPTA